MARCVACFQVLVARDTSREKVREGEGTVVRQRHLMAVVTLLIGCAVLFSRLSVWTS
jgi:hypothetical protein